MFFENRFKRIEKYLDLLRDEFIAKEKTISYKIDFTVEPDWDALVRWFFPTLKRDETVDWDIEPREFVKKIIDNHKNDINVEQSLFGKTFSFTRFYDGVSGVSSIWSYHYKRFTSDSETFGCILDSNNLELSYPIKNKYGSKWKHYLKIYPDGISHDPISTSPRGFKEVWISKIPFNDIVSLFFKIYEETGGADWQVKKFPRELQLIFDQNEIVYEPYIETYGGDLEPKMDIFEVKSKWINERGIELYSQRVQYHAFKTPYFTVNFNLEFFKPAVRGGWNRYDEFLPI